MRNPTSMALMVEPIARRLGALGLLDPTYSPSPDVHQNPIYKTMDIGRQFVVLPPFLRRRVIENPNGFTARGLLAILR